MLNTRARAKALKLITETDRQTEISDHPKWILSLLLLLLRSRRRCHLQIHRLLRRVRRRLLRCRGWKRARISTFPIPISVTLCCVSSSSSSLTLSLSLASLSLLPLFGVCECVSCAPSRLADGVFLKASSFALGVMSLLDILLRRADAFTLNFSLSLSMNE